MMHSLTRRELLKQLGTMIGAAVVMPAAVPFRAQAQTAGRERARRARGARGPVHRPGAGWSFEIATPYLRSGTGRAELVCAVFKRQRFRETLGGGSGHGIDGHAAESRNRTHGSFRAVLQPRSHTHHPGNFLRPFLRRKRELHRLGSDRIPRHADRGFSGSPANGFETGSKPQRGVRLRNVFERGALNDGSDLEENPRKKLENHRDLTWDRRSLSTRMQVPTISWRFPTFCLCRTSRSKR